MAESRGLFGRHHHKSEEQSYEAEPTGSRFKTKLSDDVVGYGYEGEKKYSGDQSNYNEEQENSSEYGFRRESKSHEYGYGGEKKSEYGYGGGDEGYGGSVDSERMVKPSGYEKQEESEDAFKDGGGYGGGNYNDEERRKAELKSSKHKEHLGELGALAAGGAYAMYERHEAKKDPEHAGRHKMEEEIAAVAAVGSGGYAFHEHHRKEGVEQEGDEKKHRFF